KKEARQQESACEPPDRGPGYKGDRWPGEPVEYEKRSVGYRGLHQGHAVTEGCGGGTSKGGYRDMGRPGTEERKIAYSPLESQRRFHASTARFKGFSGPIGSGKSQALCQEAIKLSYLNAGRLGLMGAPTYPMLRDATQAALLEVLDANDIPYDQNKAENSLTMKDTGSRILFRPVEEVERLRGANLAWFGVGGMAYRTE